MMANGAALTKNNTDKNIINTIVVGQNGSSKKFEIEDERDFCLLYTSPSPRDS